MPRVSRVRKYCASGQPPLGSRCGARPTTMIQSVPGGKPDPTTATTESNSPVS
jgi:hypothetical protein